MVCMFKVIDYYLKMCLKTFKIDVLKYMSLTQLIFYQYQDQHDKLVKKTYVELELLTDIDMCLMVENRENGEIRQAIHRYAAANNKYTKNCDRESSYFMYQDALYLYGWSCLKNYLVIKVT